MAISFFGQFNDEYYEHWRLLRQVRAPAPEVMDPTMEEDLAPKLEARA